MESNNAASTANMRSPRNCEQLSQKIQEQSLQNQQQQQQQQQTHHLHQQHRHSQSPQRQQQNNEHQQQFCLRWHNHQTSLLSTLPILLDQSHLTDVTISAEGRTLRAHRVVLSACSSFFLEIFRTLDNTHHPVIIIPGASFQAIVALLTFMYSGEVNVYEEQIPTLLSLAETLGIKGLADVHNNKSHKTTLDAKDSEESDKSLTPPTPPPSSSSLATSGNFTMPHAPAQSSVLPNSPLTSSPFSPLLNPVLNSKFPSPLENFFLKSLQFYPNLMHQPLNFSQTALNKTSEILAKYQQQCSLYQANLALNSKDMLPLLHNDDGARSNLADDVHATKRFCTGLEKKSSMPTPQMCGLSPMNANLQSAKDIKRIDKIVENLRGSTTANIGSTGKLANHDNNGNSAMSPHIQQNQLSPLTIKTSMDNYSSNSSPLMQTKSGLFSSPTSAEPNSPLHNSQLNFNISAEDQLKLQQHLDKYAASCAVAAANNEHVKQEPRNGNEKLNTPQSPQNKTPSSSKLYATCFICHKQLSNQYNLRVHLETHQNVRYACNVCSHVSRSKDALRKHVSYRHPGAPSPCETEARRKRANKLLASTINAAAAAAASASPTEDMKPMLPNTPPALQQSFQSCTNVPTIVCGSDRTVGEQMSPSPQQQLTAAQLNTAYQMFLPNQFHLAATAANAVQQHFRESQQSPNTPTPTPTTTPTKELGTSNLAAATNVQTTFPSSTSPSSAAEVSKSVTINNNNNIINSPKQTSELTSLNITNSLEETRISSPVANS